MESLKTNDVPGFICLVERGLGEFLTGLSRSEGVLLLQFGAEAFARRRGAAFRRFAREVARARGEDVALLYNVHGMEMI